jgi:hypothetical protein
MGMIAAACEPLAWLGRQGTRAVAASIFVGLAAALHWRHRQLYVPGSNCQAGENGRLSAMG